MEISGGVKLAASDSKNTGNARFDRRNAFKCRIAARLLRRLIPQKPLDSTRRVRVVGGPLIHDALTSTCVHACTHACTHAARNQKQRERERESRSTASSRLLRKRRRADSSSMHQSMRANLCWCDGARLVSLCILYTRRMHTICVQGSLSLAAM